MQKKSMAVFALLVAMLFPLSLQASSTRVSCHDPDGIGGQAGEWYARYKPAAGGRVVEFEELGFRPYRGWNIFYGTTPDTPWQVSVRLRIPAPLQVQQVTTRELLAGTVPMRLRRLELYPQLLTPNGHCTIYLRTYDYLAASDPKPSGPRVAIVGDSLLQPFVFEQKSRRELAQEFAQHNWYLEISAIGGRAWQMPAGEPVGTSMQDEIRGLLTTRPDIFAFELGTNDALLIAKSRLVQTGITTEQTRRYTVAQIAQMLKDVDTYAPAMCKILMSPSTHPYLMSAQYIDEAIFVGDVLRFFAGMPTRTDVSDYVKGLKPIHNVRLLDWASESAGMAAQMPDGIHMNSEAYAFFRSLWIREIAACENDAAAVNQHGVAK